MRPQTKEMDAGRVSEACIISLVPRLSDLYIRWTRLILRSQQQYHGERQSTAVKSSERQPQPAWPANERQGKQAIPAP